MTRRILIAVAAGALTGCFGASYEQQDQLPSKKETDSYLREAEKAWSQSILNHDRRLPERILADDFIGVSSDGSVQRKADAVRLPSLDSKYVATKLNDLTLRHFGATVIAQSIVLAKSRDGTGDQKWIRTDVWVFSNGRWLVVASHISRQLES